MANPTHVIDYEVLEVVEDLSYEEKPLEILACKVKDSTHQKHCICQDMVEKPTNGGGYMGTRM